MFSTHSTNHQLLLRYVAKVYVLELHYKIFQLRYMYMYITCTCTLHVHVRIHVHYMYEYNVCASITS